MKFDPEQGYLGRDPQGAVVVYVPRTEVLEVGWVPGVTLPARTCEWPGCKAFAYDRYQQDRRGRRGQLCFIHKYRTAAEDGRTRPPVFRISLPDGDGVLSLFNGVLVSPTPWYGLDQMRVHPWGMRIFVHPNVLECPT